MKSRIQETYLERLSKIRRNVLSVLKYGTLVPFNWTTKGFQCFYCRKPVKDCDELKQHTNRHKSIDLENFIPKRIISKDVPVKVDVTDISCKFCPETTLNNLEDLISHIMDEHDETYDTNSVCVFPFLLAKEDMKCVLCEKIYDNFTSMVNHMHKEHATHSCVCQICGLTFMSQIRLKRHFKNRHVGYTCSVCGKIFSAPQRMEKHKARYHGEKKQYPCSLCSQIFENDYKMKVHLGKTHNVEKYSIQCEFCPKVCTSKSAKILHVKSKHSELKYECDVCDYKSGIKWLITLHKRKHNGERNYACSVCDKQFKRSSNLRAHMKVHSGVSGRVCRFCRRGFTDLETLNKHEVETHYDNC